MLFVFYMLICLCWFVCVFVAMASMVSLCFHSDTSLSVSTSCVQLIHSGTSLLYHQSLTAGNLRCGLLYVGKRISGAIAVET